jgi:hypothetical protein
MQNHQYKTNVIGNLQYKSNVKMEHKYKLYIDLKLVLSYKEFVLHNAFKNTFHHNYA